MNSNTYVIVSIISSVILFFIGIRITKSIKRYGFTLGNIWGMIMILFYYLVPFIYLFSSQNRDMTTLFNILLNTHSNLYISMWMLVCVMIIALFQFVYEFDINKESVTLNKKGVHYKVSGIDETQWKKINKLSYNKIMKIADVSLLLGIISIMLIIISSGGITDYLALGSVTRGVDKDVSDYLNTSLLPLITLSNVIIIAPYLYKYLYHISNNEMAVKIKYIISFIFSILFLLYNQGRLPLILFLVPFILNLKITKKIKIGGLLLLVILTFPFLNVLSSFFIYVTYGYWEIESNGNILRTLLLEFTYPFSNFINKENLVQIFGFRFGIDYVQWPFFLIPSSILKIFGINKSNFQTIGSLNTNAYSNILNMSHQGGVPTDFLTFNYYQFGAIALIAAVIILARILRNIDNRLVYVKNNSALDIIVLRVCFLLISLSNNFDFSVIFRMRYDILVLIYVILYVHLQTLKFEKREGI